VLYNDAYAEILGKKHPGALGRPCREVWAESWDRISPMLEGVLSSGKATWSEDHFSLSPVRGASGDVDGIFAAVIEGTRRIPGERRRDELVAVVSQELRKPLAALAAAVHALRVSRGPVEPDVLERMESELEQMARITDDLLAMSHILGGSAPAGRDSPHPVAAAPGA
jgi:signal transduction histidine kinase